MTSKFGVKDKKKRSYQDSQKEFDTTLLNIDINVWVSSLHLAFKGVDRPAGARR
ncbi:unknown [Prevotella sp. CAG:1320]|nr:unknown [Prevotella sp. CAG:1320]